MRLDQVFAYLQSMPWALEERFLGRMVDVFMRHEVTGKLTEQEIQAATGRARGSNAPASLALHGDVAVIPVRGVLDRYAADFQDVSAPVGTSQEAIQRDLRAAAADPTVRSILLSFDSPGGAIGGLLETAALIRETAAKKPTSAYLDQQCCSAAYWLASQADHIYCSADSHVGSIGVYCPVIDRSQEFKTAGRSVDLIKAGALKGGGYPGTSLSPEQRASIQKNINSLYAMFVDQVAQGRELDRAQAEKLATGEVWVGAEAIAVGLVDEVATLDQVIQKLRSAGGVAGAPHRGTLAGDNDMSTDKTQGTSPATLEQLEEAFPGEANAAFVLGQVKAKATLQTAELAFSKMEKTRLEARTAQLLKERDELTAKAAADLKKAQDETAAVRASLEKAKKENNTPGFGAAEGAPAAGAGSADEVDPNEDAGVQFKKLCDKKAAQCPHLKGDWKAIAKLVRAEHPELAVKASEGSPATR